MHARKTIECLHYYNYVNAIPFYKDWGDLEESGLGRVYQLANAVGQITLTLSPLRE